jgi:hypothetical protein
MPAARTCIFYFALLGTVVALACARDSMGPNPPNDAVARDSDRSSSPDDAGEDAAAPLEAGQPVLDAAPFPSLDSDSPDIHVDTPSDGPDAGGEPQVDAPSVGPESGILVAEVGGDQDHGGPVGDALACTRTMSVPGLPAARLGQSHPVSMVVGDLNRDGKLDVVTANSGVNGVSVLLGKGDGTFGPSTEYAAGADSRVVALGDLDNDGAPDIVSANFSADTIGVLLGQGDGTFAAPVDYGTGKGPNSIALADIDGDGVLDLVVANFSGNSLTILLGKGDGTLAAGGEYETSDPPRTVVPADLNRDGRLDLVVGYGGNYTHFGVWLGQGSGVFSAGQDFTPLVNLPGGSLQAIGDLNGDGYPDAVVVLPLNAVAAVYTGVLLGKGDGTFAEPIEISASGHVVGLHDVDGDQRLDLISVLSSDIVEVHRGLGDGTFADWTSYGLGRRIDASAVGDMNGDGKLDLVAAFYGYDGDSVGVIPGTDDGAFVIENSFATGRNPQSIALFDLDGDGNLDVVTVDFRFETDGNGISVLLGDGDGTFSPNTSYPTEARPTFAAVGDVTGDGRPDIVTANSGGSSVSVLVGRGDGTFSKAVDYATGPDSSRVALGDVNGDGLLDIVATCSGGQPYSGVVSVLLAKAGGDFAGHVDYALPGTPLSVALGDLDGDGSLDVVVLASAGADGKPSRNLLLGNGDGSFTWADIQLGEESRDSVAVADLNTDGRLDIVTVSSGGFVSVWLGAGAGSFAAAAEYGAGKRPTSVAVADVDGDGKLDVVVALPAEQSVGVLAGKGDGTLAEMIRYPMSPSGGTPALALGDLNNDGMVDFVALSERSLVTVMVGACQ